MPYRQAMCNRSNMLHSCPTHNDRISGVCIVSLASECAYATQHINRKVNMNVEFLLAKHWVWNGRCLAEIPHILASMCLSIAYCHYCWCWWSICVYLVCRKFKRFHIYNYQALRTGNAHEQHIEYCRVSVSTVNNSTTTFINCHLHSLPLIAVHDAEYESYAQQKCTIHKSC